MLSKNKILLSLLLGQLLTSTQAFSGPGDDDKGKSIVVAKSKAVVLSPNEQQNKLYKAIRRSSSSQDAQVRDIFALARKNDVTSIDEFTLEGDEYTIISTKRTDSGEISSQELSKSSSDHSHTIITGATEDIVSKGGSAGISVPGMRIGGSAAFFNRSFRGENSNSGENRTSSKKKKHAKHEWDKRFEHSEFKAKLGDRVIKGVKFGQKPSTENQASYRRTKIKREESTARKSRTASLTHRQKHGQIACEIERSNRGRPVTTYSLSVEPAPTARVRGTN